MAFYVSFETPGFLVTIHRARCGLCRDGHYQPDGFGAYLSWSGPLGDYEAALAHARVNYSFFPEAANCPLCGPEWMEDGQAVP